jgi:osmoprotectant transport system ATP-binding protein
MNEKRPAIEFEDVSFEIAEGKKLLVDLNLSIDRGETVVLLGRSGSGKTTTVKMVNRLLDPTSGEVRVEGISTGAWDPIILRRRIGYVIQEIGLFPHLTVEENIGLVPRLESWPADKIRNRARELLAMVSLEPDRFAARYPAELSGGQRQRVGVARALAADPPMILLDEPFGALDPITRREIQQEFRSLQKQLGKTMVFVTHDVREAFALATRIGLLKDGEMIVLGPPAELLASSHPEAQAFVQCFHDSETAQSSS